MREIVTAASQQGRRAAAVSSYVDEVVAKMGQLTTANREHIASMSAAAAALETNGAVASQG